MHKYTDFFNNCHLSFVILPWAHLARKRRKVIHDGQKLRIRGLEITVR